MNKSHRGTIFSVEAEVLQQTAYPGGQYIARLRAPDCARTATAGSFVHVQCTPGIPMRRPLSILRANAAEGWVEVLYKVVGQGLLALTAAEPGDRVSVLGPIGQGFRPDPARPVALLIGGGVGIPPLMFLAEVLAHSPGHPLRAPRLLRLGAAVPLRGQHGGRHAAACSTMPASRRSSPATPACPAASPASSPTWRAPGSRPSRPRNAPA